MANLRSGGFKGGVMAADTAEAIAALPAAPDLAVIATPPAPALLPALAAKGTFAAVVVCGADSLSDPACRAGVRVLGPESFGIAVPGIGLNATRGAPAAARRPNRTGVAVGLAVPHRAGLGAAERHRLQPHRRHRPPRGYRLRRGAGLAVARSRHRRDPARHQAVAGPARVPLRRPRRVAAAPGGGASARRCARRPRRRLGARLRGGAASRGRAVRRQPRGPADGSRDPRPRPAGPQRGAEHRHQRDRRRTDGGRRGAARRTATGGRHRPRGAGRFCAFGRAGRCCGRCPRRRRRPGGARADRRGRSGGDRGPRRGS